MKKLLVPIDGSECSKLAIEKAKEIAKAFKSEVILLHVIDMPSFKVILNPGLASVTGSGAVGPVPPAALASMEESRESIQETAEKILESAKAQCIVLGDKVSTVLLEGRPADMIIEFIDANKDIDLVVMGSHGMTGFRRFFIGSVTYKVALSIDRPILIVR